MYSARFPFLTSEKKSSIPWNLSVRGIDKLVAQAGNPGSLRHSVVINAPVLARLVQPLVNRIILKREAGQNLAGGRTIQKASRGGCVDKQSVRPGGPFFPDVQGKTFLTVSNRRKFDHDF